MSIVEFPDKELNRGANIPSGAFCKNPEAGDAPFNHELSDLVAKPRPKSLSENTQRKIKERNSLNACQILFSVSSFTKQL